ncbi:hypothetical protein AAC387_Pa06g2016 [Persea americana]
MPQCMLSSWGQMASNSMLFFVLVFWASLAVIHASEQKSEMGLGPFLGLSYRDRMDIMKSIKATSFAVSPSPSPSGPSPATSSNPRVYHVTTYGADPTGQTDSTDAILRAISDAFRAPDNRQLINGIPDLGGAVVHLDGGSYKISHPLRLPASGGGNLQIHSGSLHASDDFPTDRHLIELWPASAPKLESTDQEEEENTPIGSLLESFNSSYEFITLKNLLLDSNYRGGGVSVINSLRTNIDNCYITHFTTDGILVRGGHETYIRNSFLGQHITAGSDPDEKYFSGTAINLTGNDNAITDVVIFSAAIGVLVAGQANILTGVHCYNKATHWGGTGIYVQLPCRTETRIVNCYLDYTGVVAEDPVQLHISNSFFYGNAYVVLKSITGIINGLSIVDNIFSGGGNGVDIVQLDQSNGPFTTIDQVIVDRNHVQGMRLKSTVAKGSIQGNQSIWTADFSPVLLFSNRISHVEYTLQVTGSFPSHALRNVSGNRIVIESDRSVPATVYISVDQNM